MRTYRLGLLPYQQKMYHATNPFTFAVMGRGSGKTYTLSAIGMIRLLSGQNLIMAAQKYDALRDVLFRQLRNRAKEWGLEDSVKFCMNPLRVTYKDWTIFGSSYEAIEGVRGLDDITGLLLDEVALAPLDILDVLTPCLRGPDVVKPFVLGATTPRSTSLWNHRFAGKLAGSEDWDIVKATTYDNLSLTKEQLDVIERGMQSEAMRRQELYADIVLSGDGNTLIHEDEFPSIAAPTTDGRVMAGLDLAKGTTERDAFGWFVRRGNTILDIKEFHGKSHEWVVKYILDFHKRTPITMLNMDLAWSEYAFNILKYHMPCRQVHFAERASEGHEKEYANIRAEMWFNLAWHVKHGLHPGFPREAIVYDADGNLVGSDAVAHLRQQLCTCTWHRDSQGRLLVIDKDEWRKLIGMSPDVGDAAALTCLDRYTGDDPAVRQVTAADSKKYREQTRRELAMMG